MSTKPGSRTYVRVILSPKILLSEKQLLELYNDFEDDDDESVFMRIMKYHLDELEKYKSRYRVKVLECIWCKVKIL
jgi:hypothetical protein